MKAVWMEEGRVGVRDLPTPPRRSGEALLRLRVAGTGAVEVAQLAGRVPCSGVPGHEFVADVLEADSADLVGRKVVCQAAIPCGACRQCQRNLQPPHAGVALSACLNMAALTGDHPAGLRQPSAGVLDVPPSTPAPPASTASLSGRRLPVQSTMFDCRSSRSCLAPVRIGIGPHPGCFAELFVLPESILVPIPPNIRDYDAVMATDLSLAVAVVARVPRPARILVSGRGAEALALAAGLLADGLSLFVRAPHEPHMDLLSWHGIRRDPGGVFPLVVDCSGDSASAAASLARVEPGGVCVLVAAADLPLLVDARPVALSGVTVVGIAERPLAASLARLADDSLCQMLSKVRRTIFALDEAEQAFEAMARPGTLKVLLDNIGLRPGRSRR